MADELVQIAPRARSGPTVEAVVDALQRAWAFVEREGSDFDRLRFLVLLDRETPEALLERVSALQDDAGLFSAPVDGEELPGGGRVANTLRVLCALDDCESLRGPAVERCIAALSALQRSDGLIEEEGGSDEEHRLFLTGTCGAYFVKSGCARLPTIDGAVEALARAWSQERVSALSWPLLASYTHLLTNLSHEIGDEALAWCGRELDKGIGGGELSALEVARIFLFCDAFALPGGATDGDALLGPLLSAQREDGSFAPAPDRLGLQTVGEATLSAVLALSHFGRGLSD